ncbi:MAG: LamG domain-containing protein [Promethearchaeota archaeon]
MVLYERLGRDIDRNLKGYWKLNDLQTDTTNSIDLINFNDGTITAGVGTTDMKGINKNAILFDGSSTNIDYGDISEINVGTGDFTMMAWIKPTDNSVHNVIMSKDIYNDDFSFRLNDDAFIRFYLNGTASLKGTTSIQENQWYHVAVTRNDSTITLYIDGVSEDTGTNSGEISNANSFLIGTRGIGGLYFNGSICCVRFYDVALESQKIKKIYRLRI